MSPPILCRHVCAMMQQSCDHMFIFHSDGVMESGVRVDVASIHINLVKIQKGAYYVLLVQTNCEM